MQVIWNGCAQLAKAFALDSRNCLLNPTHDPVLCPNQVHLSHRDSPGRGYRRDLQNLYLANTIRRPSVHLLKPLALSVVHAEDRDRALSSCESQWLDSLIPRLVAPKARHCKVPKSACRIFAVICLSACTESHLNLMGEYVKT